MTIFDLDGTLIDSNGVWLQIDLNFLAQRNLPYTRAYSEYVSHAPYRDAAAYTKAFFNLPESVDTIVQIWSDMALEAYSSTIELKPGVLPYLTALRDKGETMAIATSCMDHLCDAVLEQTGIRSFFSSVTTVRETKLGKRSPELFLLAAQKERADPKDCIVYEDSPVACQSARLADMQVVGVYDPFFAKEEPEMRRICQTYIYSFFDLL